MFLYIQDTALSTYFFKGVKKILNKIFFIILYSPTMKLAAFNRQIIKISLPEKCAEGNNAKFERRYKYIKFIESKFLLLRR